MTRHATSKCVRVVSRGFASGTLEQTPLNAFHLKHNATMVDFAGYSMPLIYKGQSHLESHNWVRSRAGLFDVSHMLQHRFQGKDATKLIESVTPTDLGALKPFTTTLSVLLNSRGGIIDDAIICKHADHDYYIVTNAGCRQKDLAFFQEQADARGLSPHHEIIEGGLVALQGPDAASALQKLTVTNLAELGFGETRYLDLLGEKMHVSRGGYTGEDGFEISVGPKNAKSTELADALCSNESVKPAGLAARDSLRLEAGMCLYGHDISEEISPIEARLTWVIAKSRREDNERGQFNGAKVLRQQLVSRPPAIRTGLISSGPAPREGCEVIDNEDNVVGKITSGSLSPTLKKNVAMAYLPRNLAKKGTELRVVIRGKPRPATTSSMPFVEPKYYRKE